jgi:S-disulfanyl-L-cysteine oxidoreductase SoxD
MSRSAKLLAASLACAALTGAAGFMTAGVAEPAKAPVSTASIEALPSGLGLGREAKPEEIAGWAISVRPDGEGLPDGRGTVFEGEEIYVAQCAVCHGDFGEGAGRWPMLAGGDGTLASHDPVKTIGSYWPYASTLIDYIYRAMPYGNAQSLTPNELYAVTAYILYLNDVIVDEDFELNRENFATIRLPNEAEFYPDDRETTEAHFWKTEPCMENCAEGVADIRNRARALDVTPEAGQAPRVE